MVRSGLFFILTVVVCLVGCGFQDSSPVLARVNGETITKNQFIERVSVLPGALRRVVMRRRKDFVEEIIEERFLLKEAERRGLGKEPDVERLLEAARQKILAAKLVEIEIDSKIKISEEDLKHYYDVHAEEFMTPLKLRASHILVKIEDEAIDLKALLDTGSDFAELARKHSIDKTATRGGDVGYFQKGQVIPEFEAQAMSMKVGELAGPLKSSFGYHLILLTDRQEPKARDYDTVKTLVRQRSLAEKKSKAMNKLVERLKQGAKIEIDEKALAAIVEEDFKSEESSND